MTDTINNKYWWALRRSIGFIGARLFLGELLLSSAASASPWHPSYQTIFRGQSGRKTKIGEGWEAFDLLTGVRPFLVAILGKLGEIGRVSVRVVGASSLLDLFHNPETPHLIGENFPVFRQKRERPPHLGCVLKVMEQVY